MMKLIFPAIKYQREPIESTQRVREVIHSFGYLASAAPHRANYTITDSFEACLGKINVILGSSGSGKTSLLKEAEKLCSAIPLPPLPKYQRPLIDMLGNNMKEAISLLSMTGLGEGNLFLRTPNQLSDGQQFRLRLALQFNRQDERLLIVDEFASQLDPSTGCALARSLSRGIRKHNRQPVLLCCNDETVAHALNADCLICLRQDATVSVTYPSASGESADINEDLSLRCGDVSDYVRFKRYHYLDCDGNLERSKVVLASFRGKDIGIQILNPALSPKRERLHPYFKTINKHLVTGHRTVVHPEYRGMGAGKALALSAPKLCGADAIETRSTLFYFSPIPLEWGYLPHDYGNYFNCRPAYDAVENYIRELGADPDQLMFPEVCESAIRLADLKHLGHLLKADEDERHTAQLNYYLEIMASINRPYVDSREELASLITCIDPIPGTPEAIKSLLLKHHQSQFRAFYKAFN